MSGSPSLRAPWKRHFFMELKTSGSSISSESSDSTCSISIVTKELVPKNTKRAENLFTIHKSYIHISIVMCQVITYCYLQKPHVNQFRAPLHIVPPLWSWNPLVSQVFQ